MKPVQLSAAQTIIAQSDAHGVAMAAGPSVPANGTAGYSPGCLFVKLSADAAKTDGVFLNTGNRTSAAFKPMWIQTESSVLIPFVTEAQRDLLLQQGGSIAFNTTSGNLSVHNGVAWEEFAPL